MRTHLLLSTAAFALIGASSAFAGSNTVYLDQYDNSQYAQIIQGGDHNHVGSAGNSFYQQNYGGSGYNALTINQSGSNNWVSRYSAGFQRGTQNNALINQTGNGNDIELQQTGYQNGYGYVLGNNGGAYNSIQQDGSANSSFVSVSQDGTRNGFDILQGGGSNQTRLTQTGIGGVAYIRQGTAAHDQSTGHDIYGGSNSQITVNQASASVGNAVVAMQGTGDGNNMNITQSGDQLYANAWQSGGGNTLTSLQSGVGSTLFSAQSGYGNNIQSTQGYYSSATLSQNGNNNTIVGSQINGIAGYVNVANVSQVGSNNYANYGQNGYANNFALTQTNDGNVSVNNQNGIGNVLSIVQN